jgi:hypothetical protein
MSVVVTKKQVVTFLQDHGDFKIYGTESNYMVFNGVDALNALNLWHWIKCFDPNRGFVMSGHNNVSKLQTFLEKDDHSGVTLACLLRLLQKISIDCVKGDGENIECTICFQDQYGIDPITQRTTKTTLECGHMFHCACIQKWHSVVKTNTHKGCPNCRRDTLPDYD